MSDIDERSWNIRRKVVSLREFDDELRDVGQTLNVSRSFLYSLSTEKLQHALRLPESIYELQAEETATEDAALKHLQDELRPVLAGNDTRGMTVGEARAELERRTAETIRGLETDFGA